MNGSDIGENLKENVKFRQNSFQITEYKYRTCSLEKLEVDSEILQ